MAENKRVSLGRKTYNPQFVELFYLTYLITNLWSYFILLITVFWPHFGRLCIAVKKSRVFTLTCKVGGDFYGFLASAE